jgi:phage protein D
MAAMEPTFTVMVDGTDVSANFRSRLVSLRVTDRLAGPQHPTQSDTIEITLSDENGILNIPRRGAWILASLGWNGKNHPMGEYNVDRVITAGGGERAWTMTVIGMAAALGRNSGLKNQQSRHFENTTLGNIAEKIASEAGFALSMSPELAQRRIGYEAQTEESAMNFISRLARRNGAALAIKNRTLVFWKEGTERPANAEGGEVYSVDRNETLMFRALLHERGAYREVRSHYIDGRTFQRRDVIVPQMGGAQGEIQMGHANQNEQDAKAAAEAKSAALNRDGESLLIEVHGRPDIRAGGKLRVNGIRPGVDGQWPNIDVVEHILNENGFRTLIECRGLNLHVNPKSGTSE